MPADSTKVNNFDLRIFDDAPSGTVVSLLDPAVLAPGISPSDLRFRLDGREARRFRLDGHTLLTASRVRKSLGDIYSFNLEVTSRIPHSYVIALWNVTVTVSKKNMHAPRFPQDFFRAEVYRYADVSKKILRITAEDYDDELYNCQVFYSLAVSDSSSLFTIETDTGWLKTAETMREAKPLIHLQVVAMDTGSPPLSRATTVTIILRDIAEPKNVTATVTNTTAARICWRSPGRGAGRVEKFIVSYTASEGTDLTKTKVVRRGRRRNVCTVLSSLREVTEYWAEVRALDGGKSGVPVRIWFSTQEDACASSPCARGTCVSIRRVPYYRCEGDCVGAECDEIPLTDTDGEGDQCSDDESCSEDLVCLNGGTLRTTTNTEFCDCPAGFTGDSCELVELCSDDGYCRNGGSCKTFSKTEFRCVCAEGYFGERCQYSTTCSGRPCRNGGVCINVTETDYDCSCPVGYFGRNCTRFDSCSSSPCQNNGICRNISDFLYTCRCATGYHGYDCENYNPCYHDPCLHGGMCNSVDGNYVCECGFGRFGRHCERMNLCDHLRPCGGHALACKNTTDASYQCVCEPGYSGENCTNYDPCHSRPCEHSGVCAAGPGREYLCHCNGPYYGAHCEKINHCVLSPCKNGGVCRNNSDSSYTCACQEGYYGAVCDRLNPCAKALCENNGYCVNTSESTYVCRCPLDYFGTTCQHFNSCVSEPCRFGRCRVLQNGQYECDCQAGYTGRECHTYDPCSSSPCRYGGLCVNSTDPENICICKPGFHGTYCELFDACQSNPCRRGSCEPSPDETGFSCVCPAGMFGPTCESTDPCTGNPCQNHGTCISTHGASFRCICPSGYGGPHCEDFNPCVSNPCHSSSTCRHSGRNAFICECPPGRQGDTCQTSVPCDGQMKNCHNTGTCMKDLNGSTYCKCSSGFTGLRCEVFNPCDSERPCLNDGTCAKLEVGRYECHCPPGFFGERCEYHTPCRTYICQNNGTCVQTPEGDTCKCSPGLSGVLCEQDIDECRADCPGPEEIEDCGPLCATNLGDCVSPICENGATCRNSIGSYTCICAVGFRGSNCQYRVMCDGESMYEATGTYNWPSIQHGETAELACPRNHDNLAVRSCQMNPNGRVEWGEPDFTVCSMTIKTAEDALRGLEPFKNRSLALHSPQQIAKATSVIHEVVPIAHVETQVASDMVFVIDQILQLPDETIRQSNSSSRLLEAISEFVEGVQLRKANYTLTASHIHVYIESISSRQMHSGTSYKPLMARKSQMHIDLPPEVFQGENPTGRAHFVYFRNSKLFASSHDDVTEVISATVGLETKNLRKCIVITMMNIKGPPQRCVYYDEEAAEWSSVGLVTMSSDIDNVRCCANHLSYFSTLTDHAIKPVSQEKEFLTFLVSYCGTGVSILFLFIVLLTYSLFRTLNREGFGQLVMQLSLCVLLWQVTLLVGFQREQVDDSLICLVLAVMTHFLTLASLLWAALMAHHVYSLLGRNADINARCFICTRMFLAWLLPAVAIGVPLGLDMDVYRGDSKRCIIAPTNRWLYCGAYLTPCCVILFTNLVLFVMVIKTSIRPRYELKSFSIGQTQVRGTCIILSLMGFSWALGFLAERQEGLYFDIYVYEYAYFGVNTLIGISICVFYCLLRRDACAAWRNACCRHTKRRRVAGKSAIGTTTMKSEGSDYTLVVERKMSSRHSTNMEEEKMLEPEPSYRHSTGHLAARDYCRNDYSRGLAISDNHDYRQTRQYRAVDTDSCPASPIFAHRNRSFRRSHQSGEIPHRTNSMEWMAHSSRI